MTPAPDLLDRVETCIALANDPRPEIREIAVASLRILGPEIVALAKATDRLATTARDVLRRWNGTEWTFLPTADTMDSLAAALAECRAAKGDA